MRYEDIKENTELYDVARLFFGDEFDSIKFVEEGGQYTVAMCGKNFSYAFSDEIKKSIPEVNREGRLAKIALYKALCAFTGRSMPWGALTGVRPTKLFYECIKGGKTPLQTEEIMREVYGVSDSRAKLLHRIYAAQEHKVFYPNDMINLYVHIPYCTSRCSYCSFVSAPISKNREQSERYTDLLCEEVKMSVDALEKRGKKILSVYIGGGTPTSLDERELEKILCAIGKHDVEYTCEAGRPDSIDARKMKLLKDSGVTRVCVNPQTLNENTLKKIGRSHTVDEFYRAFELCRSLGFDINCDVIAGLESESIDDFVKTLDGIKALDPQNITVHSLSKKNGSEIRYESLVNADAPQMIEYAVRSLTEYLPYYLYRQKRQVGNLENIGFSLPEKQCINNITTMEETVGVMACGAGAISKFISPGKITRFANMRDVPLYISRFEERVKAKLQLFDALS